MSAKTDSRQQTTMSVSHKGILWISSDEMIEWGQKSNPPPTPLIYFFPTIITASKVVRGIYQIKGQFDKVTKIHPSSRAHTTRSAKDDEMLMLKDLRKLHS